MDPDEHLGMTTALILLAKAPAPGFAKTRLIPALGSGGAAALANRMLCHAVAQAMAGGFKRVELCVSPDESHIAFRRLAMRYPDQLHLTCQIDGDLGQRMQRAINTNLSAYPRVLLMGTDAPALTAKRLREAANALQNHNAALVPAYDGGYALIGLTQSAPFLFEDMLWSTSDVMKQTRSRLRDHGWRWQELESVHDIDEPEDLKHLPAEWLP